MNIPWVCDQDISKSYGWIWLKLGGQVGCVTRTTWFDFDEDLNPDTTISNFSSDALPLRDWAEPIYRLT